MNLLAICYGHGKIGCMKLKLLLPSFLLFTLISAPAQDWAKAKLDQSRRHGEWVTVTNGSRAVQCWVVYPEVKDKATAVVLIHEIFGLSDWARLAADEMAEAGYIAIAPDLLSGSGSKGRRHQRIIQPADWPGHQPVAAGPGDGRLECGGRLCEGAARGQRKSCGRRFLLGRIAVVSICLQPG